MPIPPSSATRSLALAWPQLSKLNTHTSEGHGTSERDRTADALPMRVLQ